MSLPPVWEFQSVLPGVEWPAVPAPGADISLAIQFQLERSQWLPAGRLRQLQFRQLEVLLRHSHATVPYYRDRWRGNYDPARVLTQEGFAGLPLLTRRELQNHFEALQSHAPLNAHGAKGESRTSGSTGAPVRVIKTQLSNVLWSAFTLRDHIWHQRDLSGKLAAIRHGMPPEESDNWGMATRGLVATGPAAVRTIDANAESQLSWLEQQQADYLITHPSLAAELAKISLVRGIRLARLREVRTYGELLSRETRELCRQAWQVPVIDAYSTNEVGYIALQCPEHEHYHVQSEGVLIEILDGRGAPCAPGEVGRVVATSLHNFAMPLIRYDLGDYAEVGTACSCGRGLPVLTRIIGRVRNMLVTAAGEKYWPAIGSRSFSDVAPVLQYQFIQKDFNFINVRLVTAVPLASAQESALRQMILARLPAGFGIMFEYCEQIGRSAGGKYEDFICEIAAPLNAGSQ